LPRDGGTPESKQLREEALVLLQQRQQQQEETEDESSNNNGTSSTTKTTPSSSSKKKSSKGSKLSGRERKRQEQEALQPIVVELVNEIDDFGGGFHKPTYKDLLMVSLVKLPYKIAAEVLWQLKFYTRRLRQQEFNQQEREVLTERAVGVVWSTASDEDRAEMVERKLWRKDNLLEWQEEQEIKNLSASEQKQYFKLKKKGKLDKLE